MRRRDYLRLVVSGTVALPGFLYAQEQIRLVGRLMVGQPDGAPFLKRLAAFETEMRKRGWSDSNTRYRTIWSGLEPAELTEAARALVAFKPDVIISNGTPPTKTLMRTTQSIPVVFISATDPIGSGLVESMAYPGHNVTGVTNVEFSIASKWVDIICEIAPQTKRVFVLAVPNNPGNEGLIAAIHGACKLDGVQAEVLFTTRAEDVVSTLESVSVDDRCALIVLSSSIFSQSMEQIFAWTVRKKLPVIYPSDEFTRQGGLISYGPEIAEQYSSAAIYVDRILRGAMPGSLPILLPRTFNLIVNRRTAESIGLTFPSTLLARADEVIE